MVEKHSDSKRATERKELKPFPSIYQKSLNGEYGCFHLDQNWKFVSVNREAEALLKRHREELLGKMIWDEFPDTFRSVFYFEYHKAMDLKKKVYFEEYYLPHGKWYQVEAVPFEGGIKVEFNDITPLKKNRIIQYDYYKQLFEHHPDAIYILNKEGKYLSVNNGFEKATGYTKEEAEELSFTLIAAPEDLPSTNMNFKKALNGTTVSYEIAILTKQREKRCMSITNIPIRLENGEDGIFGIARDITEKMKERERNEKNHNLYQLLLKHSQDIISYCTPEGICKYISPAVQKLLGYEPEEMRNTPIFSYYHPEDIVDMDLKKQDKEITKVRIRHKDGRYIWFEINFKVIRNKKGEIEKILGIGRDISERIETEAFMRKSEKLAMAGQLAAGVAHEIRNPLTAVKGFLQIMQGGNPLKREYIEVMYSEITRIEQIISELLLLAKPNLISLSDKDVNTILQQVVRLLETEGLKEKVIICTQYSGEELLIHCEENQMKQVFINLIKNSIEAMPAGGVIKVKTERREEEVIITFSDTGHGIPQEILPQLGQPFYSTKEKGTGLGLAVTFNIIENHQGQVHIESVLNKGTTFTITLPLVQ